MLELETALMRGAPLSTVTLLGAEVAVFPAASRATAVRVWAPFAARAESQELEKGAEVTSAPRLTPSSLNCTPARPTLSDAAAEMVTVWDTVVPPSGAVIETVGGVRSFETVT